MGACAEALAPIHALIRAHVLAAKRLHSDDTTVPLLATGGTTTARLWTYLRDDRPFAGGVAPAALYYFSTDRRMEHPTRHLAGWTGILQADAYGGYNELYGASHKPSPALSALFWSHARRKFFELADIKSTARNGKKVSEEISPVAMEAVKRFDAIFEIERGINGLDAETRRGVRQELVRSLATDPHDRLRAERARMSKHNPVAKAINYMFEETAAGKPSSGSSMTAGSALRTTRQSAPCAVWLWDARPGSSQDHPAAEIVPRSCIP